MKIEKGNSQVRIADLRQGSLFYYNGSIVLKSEYRNSIGAYLCYLEETGECFWGGAIELNNLLVTPLNIVIGDN